MCDVFACKTIAVRRAYRMFVVLLVPSFCYPRQGLGAEGAGLGIVLSIFNHFITLPFFSTLTYFNTAEGIKNGQQV